MRKDRLFTDEFRGRLTALLHERAPEPLTDQQIAEQLDVRGGARKQLRPWLDALVLNGDIVRIRHDHYALGAPADLVTGTIELLRSGDGFVAPSDGGADVFVPRDQIGTALPQDRVVVRLDRDGVAATGGAPGGRGAGRRAGKVIRVLERSRRALAGTLKATQKFLYVVPLDPVYTQDFYVPDAKGAREGDRVVIQFTEWAHRHVNPEAEIIEVIGPSLDPSLDTKTIIRHFSLPDHFPTEVMREAERAPERMDAPGERRDFRDTFIFTVDPVTSRDFDDALSLGTDARGHRVLGVHIADVSHFVRPGGAMDREARQRGNSVYLPDCVLPMLPEQLSNGLCSLRPNEDRLAFSVLIAFDERGTPLHADFCRSIIRSRLRLNYGQALKALESQAVELPEAGIGREGMTLLRQIHTLAQQIRQRRFAQYALELDMPDYEVRMGPDGMIVDIEQQLNDISHQMIEECMVAANEAVDKALCTRGFALLHRVHEPPDAAKIEMLTAQLAEMGLRPGDLTKRRNMAEFLKALVGHPFEYDAKVMTLKSLKRALYSPSALGHFGLAKKYYAHFTSPIRRYPDLVVHRILAASLTGRANPYAPTDLGGLAAHCSKTEQVAEAAEKALLEIKKYRFLEQQLQRREPAVYDAVVVRVKNFGMFVELTQLQISGLVHVSGMAREFVRYDERRRALQAGRRTFKAGDRVRVRVTALDFDKRQIDFVLVEEPGAAPARGGAGAPPARSGAPPARPPHASRHARRRRR